MKLSAGERLILVMLSEIYKSNKIKGEIDPDFVLATIFNNEPWAFSWKYPSIVRSDEKMPDIVDETCDILDMYRRVSRSFEKLSAADKAKVLDESQPFGDYIKFQGFDFNNDPHAGIVGHLVRYLDRYDEINPDLNSHSSASISQYRRMVTRAKAFPTSPNWELNAGQLVKVLKG